jgi:hypothetical protein
MMRLEADEPPGELTPGDGPVDPIDVETLFYRQPCAAPVARAAVMPTS